MLNPIRVTKKQAAQLLAVTGEKIRLLVANDETFPRPYKDGKERQSAVYFDYQELVSWHKNQQEKGAL